MADVSRERQQLLEKLLSRTPDGLEDIPGVEPGTPVPLSPAQTAIWFGTRMHPGSPEYNLFDARAFDPMPDEDRLTAAIRTLMERHDALRLRVYDDGGFAVQEDVGILDPPVEWHDLRGLPADEAERRAEDLASEAAGTPLPTDRAPMFRVLAFLFPSGAGLLVLGFHHLILDHWSGTQLLHELGALLSGDPLPPSNAVGFLDYVAWEHGRRDVARDAEQIEYWKSKLGGELPVLDLPHDRPRPSMASRAGAVAAFEADAPLATAVSQFARDERVTVFTVLLAAYTALLARLTGQTDLIVGSPLAGRRHPVTEDIVGYFVNPVALRTDLSGSPSFRDVVGRVEQTLIEAQDHSDVPHDRVVAELGVDRLVGVNPVFQTVFGAQSSAELSVDGRTIEGVMLDSRTSKLDMSMLVTVSGDRLTGEIEYSSLLFDRESIERMGAMYVEVLRDALARPSARLDELSLVPAQESQRILTGLNEYAPPAIAYRTMAEPFEEQVAKTPDAVALVDDGVDVTYRDLNTRANRLAHFLAARGVGPGTTVAVCAERGVPLVVALYAIVKTGAAYAPLDPELPDGRLAFMLEDAAPAVVLADDASMAKVLGRWSVLPLEDEALWASQPAENLPARGSASDLLYLLYTSGSTGRPKAVAYPKDGALANIQWLQERYPFGPGDANVLKTSYGFDVSIWEIFWPLYFGARVVIARPGGHRDVDYLRELVEQYEVTTLFLVPSIMEAFVQATPEKGCPSLRWAFCGGERVSPRLRDAFHSKFDAALVNCCGPTEAGSVVDMVVPREPGAPVVPLGRPARNFRTYILDDDLRVLPVGVPGELFVGGDIGLAHGYHQRPSLTAEHFLPDPFGSPGSRLYRTGDLCRYRGDGVLEHLGRIGRQVKIRGLRVELGEVEAVLAEHPAVRRCVACVEPDSDGRILAFVVANPGMEGMIEQLRGHAAHLLPTHMVPARVLTVPAIPLTVNGKVDEAALLADADLVPTAIGEDLTEPGDEIEAQLAAIFRSVLGIDRLSVTDGFFALGGHSLLVFKLIAECAERLGVRPSVMDVFAAPSVRELAQRLAPSVVSSDATAVELGPVSGRPMIVLIHGASGSLLPFTPLASRLSDRFDVYGLQCSIDKPLSIEEMAAQYVAAVEAVRDTRPVTVVGWSMGGCVALEMHREWARRGVLNTGTVLLDTWFPPALVEDRTLREALVAVVEAVDLGVDDTQRTVIGDEALQALVTGLARNREAFLAYRPRWLDAQVHLLRAAELCSEITERLPGWRPPDDSGWTELVSTVVVGEIPGDHFTLVDAEHADALAAAVAEVAEGTAVSTDATSLSGKRGGR